MTSDEDAARIELAREIATTRSMDRDDDHDATELPDLKDRAAEIPPRLQEEASG
jgi:hypothetical protein